MIRTFADTLLSDWLENSELYAIRENNEDIGYVELSLESWNNRLRISSIWVKEEYRHQGIGSKLMNYAFHRAHELEARAVVLETQTCNDHAISFYLKHGFKFIGFDTVFEDRTT